MVEGEFQHIGQLAPGTALAEMLGVGVQGIGVAGLGLQDGVQIHRGLLTVTQPVAVERRQLALQLEAKRRVRRLFELSFA